LAKREIQSLDISCFIHATEDKEKLSRAVQDTLSLRDGPDEENLEGHFGNTITNLRWHPTTDQAWASFRAIVARLGEERRRALVREIGEHLDEHGALYIRLDKQAMLGGVASFSASDPIRIKVKPRSFMMKGQPARFYERMMEEAL